MYLTKPAGCAFQFIGLILIIIGGLLFLQADKQLAVLLPFYIPAALLVWRGRRNPERKKELSTTGGYHGKRDDLS